MKPSSKRMWCSTLAYTNPCKTMHTHFPPYDDNTIITVRPLVMVEGWSMDG